MANLLTRIADWFNQPTTNPENAYNQAFFSFLNGQPIPFDYNRRSYLTAYLNNPDINAIINQIADKTNEVPYYIKKIKSDSEYTKRSRILTATKGDLSLQQLIQTKLLETKAFESEEVELKLKRPNPLHTWTELIALSRIFLETDGNVYFYTVKVESGNNAGTVKQMYILPSNLVQIVLKKNADTITDENPIDYYILTETPDRRVRFDAENIIHVKYANPIFDLQGSHLYGLSPLRAALKNIMSSDEGLSHNVKNMKNGGVFGFFYSDDKDTPLTAEQALQFKERLTDMNNDPSNLARIAGASFKMGFQRLSLDADELKVIENLLFDRKVFANLLGWSDILLNNHQASTMDNIKQEKRRVLTGKVQSGLILIQEAFNDKLVPFLEGCDSSCVWEWDISEMPEMQEDVDKMIEWMRKAYLTPNEIRTAVKYETLEIEGMDAVWTSLGDKRIDDVSVTDLEIEKAYNNVIEK